MKLAPNMYAPRESEFAQSLRLYSMPRDARDRLVLLWSPPVVVSIRYLPRIVTCGGIVGMMCHHRPHDDISKILGRCRWLTLLVLNGLCPNTSAGVMSIARLLDVLFT